MATNNIKKNARGYNYKYADLAQIHEYLEEQGKSYYQYVERIEGDDYIMTVKVEDGKELPPMRGCRVVQARLDGKTNPAQEQGSALTYARRYSLLMAYGLATTDDDAQMLDRRGGDVKETALKAVSNARTIDELQGLYKLYAGLRTDEDFLNACKARKEELK